MGSWPSQAREIPSGLRASGKTICSKSHVQRTNRKSIAIDIPLSFHIRLARHEKLAFRVSFPRHIAEHRTSASETLPVCQTRGLYRSMSA